MELSKIKNKVVPSLRMDSNWDFFMKSLLELPDDKMFSILRDGEQLSRIKVPISDRILQDFEVDESQVTAGNYITVHVACHDGTSGQINECYLSVNGTKITSGNYSKFVYDSSTGSFNYTKGTGSFTTIRGHNAFILSPSLELVEACRIDTYDNSSDPIDSSYVYQRKASSTLASWINQVRENHPEYILVLIGADAISCDDSLRSVLASLGGLQQGTAFAKRVRHYFIGNLGTYDQKAFEGFSEDPYPIAVSVPVKDGKVYPRPTQNVPNRIEPVYIRTTASNPDPLRNPVSTTYQPLSAIGQREFVGFIVSSDETDQVYNTSPALLSTYTSSLSKYDSASCMYIAGSSKELHSYPFDAAVIVANWEGVLKVRVTESTLSSARTKKSITDLNLAKLNAEYILADGVYSSPELFGLDGSNIVKVKDNSREIVKCCAFDVKLEKEDFYENMFRDIYTELFGTKVFDIFSYNALCRAQFLLGYPQHTVADDAVFGITVNGKNPNNLSVNWDDDEFVPYAKFNLQSANSIITWDVVNVGTLASGITFYGNNVLVNKITVEYQGEITEQWTGPFAKLIKGDAWGMLKPSRVESGSTVYVGYTAVNGSIIKVYVSAEKPLREFIVDDTLEPPVKEYKIRNIKFLSRTSAYVSEECYPYMDEEECDYLKGVIQFCFSSWVTPDPIVGPIGSTTPTPAPALAPSQCLFREVNLKILSYDKGVATFTGSDDDLNFISQCVSQQGIKVDHVSATLVRKLHGYRFDKPLREFIVHSYVNKLGEEVDTTPLKDWWNRSFPLAKMYENVEYTLNVSTAVIDAARAGDTYAVTVTGNDEYIITNNFPSWIQFVNPSFTGTAPDTLQFKLSTNTEGSDRYHTVSIYGVHTKLTYTVEIKQRSLATIAPEVLDETPDVSGHYNVYLLRGASGQYKIRITTDAAWELSTDVVWALPLQGTVNSKVVKGTGSTEIWVRVASWQPAIDQYAIQRVGNVSLKVMNPDGSTQKEYSNFLTIFQDPFVIFRVECGYKIPSLSYVVQSNSSESQETYAGLRVVTHPNLVWVLLAANPITWNGDFVTRDKQWSSGKDLQMWPGCYFKTESPSESRTDLRFPGARSTDYFVDHDGEWPLNIVQEKDDYPSGLALTEYPLIGRGTCELGGSIRWINSKDTYKNTSTGPNGLEMGQLVPGLPGYVYEFEHKHELRVCAIVGTARKWTESEDIGIPEGTCRTVALHDENGDWNGVFGKDMTEEEFGTVLVYDENPMKVPW